MDTSILPAQSSPLLPLPPQPRLDLLPPELLEDVVELLPRDCIRGSLYPNRQHLLRSLCLTSKRLLSFAQPALFAVMRIRSPEQAERALRRSDLLSCCRLLELETDSQDSFSGSTEAYIEAVGRLAGATRNLEALYCWGTFEIVEPFLGTNLQKLYLCQLVLPSDILLDFPRLEQLTLEGIEPPDDGPIQHHLPALRHLHLSTVDDYNFEGPLDMFLRSLTPQLTSITADIDDVSAAQASLWTTPTLYMQYVDYSRNVSLIAPMKAQIRFLELDFGFHWHGTELDELLKAIETSGPSFPLECITIQSGSRITELQHRILEMCERRSIQVVIQNFSSGSDEDVISPAFILPSFILRAEQRRNDIETGRIRK